jgi:glycosyltransferase involved in cell wall biosynthesis
MDRKSWLVDKARELSHVLVNLPPNSDRSVSANARVLDIGSNDGHTFNDTEIETVKVDLDTYHLPFFVNADAQHLPFRDGVFKVAVLGEILEHLPDPVEALKEAKRVGENILATVPIESEWDIRYKPFWTIEQRMEEEHLTARELFLRSNPSIVKPFDQDGFEHGWHVRYYDDAMIRAQLVAAGLMDAKVIPIRYDGWAFRGIQAPFKLKIGLISSPFFTVPPQRYGGLEQVVWDLADGLSKLGYDVTLFAPKGSKTPPNGHLVECGEPLLDVRVNWVEAERKAFDIYEKELQGLDIIHGHNWFGFEYLAKVHNPKLKVCHTHHGGLNPEWWARSKPPFKLNLIAISDWMTNVYNSQGFKSKRVYNGVDMDKYLFQKEKSDRLMFLGRISRIKAPHLAVEIAKKTGLGLDIVGGTSFVDDPSYVEQVKGMCDGDIKFIGEVDQETKVKYLQNAKALIVPSVFGEPFGLISVEAMAVGTPVIALADGAIPEVVSNGVSGHVCNSIEEMCEVVKSNSIKPDECRSRAMMFSKENMARAYEALYLEILNGGEW